MSAIGATGASNTSTDVNAASSLQDLSLDDFVKLMLTELQNQDPLDPLDNSQMLAQIGTMREIGASDKLTKTLDSLTFSQQISGGAALIGKYAVAVSSGGAKVEGFVESVSVKNNQALLHLAGSEAPLDNVLSVGDQPPPEEATAEEAATSAA